MSRVSQLRVYTIEPGNLDEFVRVWRSGVLPLRRKLGFVVDGAWTVPEENLFVWILSYDGPGSCEERDAAYYDSPDRKALLPDPAALIAEHRTWFISPVVLEE